MVCRSNIEIRAEEYLLYSHPQILMQREQIHSALEAGKTQTCNTFSLRRISIEQICPSIQVDFSHPITPPSSTPTSHSPHYASHSVPTFNQDSCFFTPAFILQVDREKYVSYASSYLSLHEAKKAQLCSEKNELLVPKPSKLSHFCCICKANFQDYLTHVNIPMHQQLLRNSIFNEHINKLCGMYKREEVLVTEKKGKKTNKKIAKPDRKQKKQDKALANLLNCSQTKHDCSEQAKTGALVD